MPYFNYNNAHSFFLCVYHTPIHATCTEETAPYSTTPTNYSILIPVPKFLPISLKMIKVKRELKAQLHVNFDSPEPKEDQAFTVF
jgi:hypothetical protein